MQPTVDLFMILRIAETPADAAPVAPAAFYMGPSEDGTRPGQFWVNTYKPDTRWAVEVLFSLMCASDNRRLQSECENDGRSKRFCFKCLSVLCISQNTRDHIKSDTRSKRASDQITFCAFHLLLVEVQTKLAMYVPCSRKGD